MTRAPSMSALPETDSSRWQPLRLGLVELYHYEVEEFWFRDGHLLLRGNNGTGKSKVLSLTLPFLFDADLSAARVEPDGDRNKRMDWNLLMGGRHDRRIGYTWIEFGRRDAGGALQTLTLGCGLRAVAGRGSVEPWFFITDQRIGANLWLTTPERTALSRERLGEAIGTRGQVFRTARDYRRAVDERLFHLGPERYAALVDTLIQLRQPQLSKQPNEQRLSDALTDALPPLDRAALEDVAEAMGQLEDLRRELEELDAMNKSVVAFGRRYRRYAQVATRRRARVLRQAQTEFDNASRELHAAEGELEQARAVVERVRNRETALDEQLAADRARLAVLQADPAMRDARRLDDAQEHTRRCAVGERDAGERLNSAQARLDGERAETATRTTAAAGTQARLVDIHERATRLAIACGIGQAQAEALDAVAIPDGVGVAPAEFADSFLSQARELERRRREQIEVLHRRLHALAEAERAHGLACEARDQRADAFAACTQATSDAAEHLRETSLALVTAWRSHGTGLRVLTIRDADDALDALARWVTTIAGPNPMAAALDDAERRHEAALAQRHAELATRRKALQAEQTDLESEQARLEAGQDQPPPVPYTRDEAARRVRPGAPLWQLVDFAPQVPEPARAGIEAALESAGLLDAWVTPDGSLLDARTHDAVLVARRACSAPLADWLVPGIPA
ncbi:MAG: TIGR02680 family protein, partial [Gammaproteobacteria bacterium]